MNIDWSELNNGISEELHDSSIEKKAFLPVLAGAAALAAGAPTVAAIGKKFFPKAHASASQNPYNPYSYAELARKGIVGTAAVGKEVVKAPGRINYMLDSIPGVIDSIGKFAPLAIGGMMLPSLMNKGQQSGGGGQPVVVNNYMGQKPNMLTPRAGVNSLSDPLPKTAENMNKKADVVLKALTDAAKRRMANRVIDSVSHASVDKEEKQKELEIVTKYPEMAKLLEDQENREYLNRLLEH